jgi:hypothetical protein
VITQFLEAMQFLKLAVVTAAIAGGLALLAVAAWRRNLRLAILGAVIGGAPVALPALSNAWGEATVSDRGEQVRAMPRAALPATPPRQLEIRGDMFAHDVARLMILGYFDEVVVDTGYGRTWFPAADRSDACREAVAVRARTELVFWPGMRRPGADESKSAFEKIKSCAPASGRGFALKPDRLVLRLDGAVTLREDDRRAAPEAFQLSLARGGTEALVHYDEMPVLDGQSSVTGLIAEGQDYPCYGFDDVQLVANILDAAQDPMRRQAIMERPGKPDLCIAAADPVPAAQEAAARQEHVRRQRAKLLEDPPWYLVQAARQPRAMRGR